MIYDKKRNRILLRNGESVVSSEEYVRRTLKGDETDSLGVVPSDDATIYDFLYNENTTTEIEDIDVYPDNEIEQEQVEYVISRVFDSPRWDDSMSERVEREMLFFDSTDNYGFLLRCINLIDRFKEDGVVWGVGRGSSCASLVMYLIEVNDINPLTFDIPFSEFSKVQEDY